MAKLLSNDTAAKVLRLLSEKQMTQGGGMPRDLMGDDQEPLLYELRAVTRNDVKELQVYAPEDMPLMYDKDAGYFASASLSRDTKNAKWISLSSVVSPGSPVYAYYDESTSYVLFASTEPEPVGSITPPFVKVGTTSVTGDKVTITQAWIGHYAIASSVETILPWSCRLDETGANILVRVGRVYEVRTVPIDGGGNLSSICFYEPYNYSNPPGSDYSITKQAGTLAIVCDPTSDVFPSYTIGYIPVSGKSVIKPLAEIGSDDSIEQIHIGDVSFSKERLNSFKLSYIDNDGSLVLYIPEGSIVINGKVMSFSGLTASSATDWYKVQDFVTTGLNLYIEMGSTSATAGTPQTAAFADTPPSGASGEQIKIPILIAGANGLASIQHGSVCMEILRPDDSTLITPSHSSMEAFDMSSGSGKIQLKNFVSGTEPTDIKDTGFVYKFAVREDDQNGFVIIKWYPYTSLKADIDQEVSDYLDAFDWGSVLTSTWQSWYDNLDDADKKFWERGASEAINYGSAIGNSAKTKVIDLDAQTIENGGSNIEWKLTANWIPSTTNTYNLGLPDYYWANTYTKYLYVGELYADPAAGSIATHADIIAPFGTGLGGAASSTYAFTFLKLATAGYVMVNDLQVVGARQAAVADATGLGDIVAQFNLLLARVRDTTGHGLIAT